MATSDFKWAAGFNNAGGLASVESVVPSFQGRSFYVRSTVPDEGVVRQRADKMNGTAGFKRFTWLLDVISDQQYLFIQSTYTPGGTGLTARMTVRTLTGYPSGVAAYANFSAVLHLPKRSEMDPILNAFLNVPLLFIVEAAL